MQQQRVSDRNLERFAAARMMRPSLTFDQWVEELWCLAVGGTPSEPAPRGRPPGSAAPGAQMTGGKLRPLLLRMLLEAPRNTLARSDLIERLEKSLKGQLVAADQANTSAGIASWKHRLLSEVAQLRKRGMLEPQRPGESNWSLTPRGLALARSIQKS